MDVFLLLLALLGHAFLWIGLVNRLHSVGVRRWIVGIVTLGCFASAALIPFLVGWWYLQHRAMEGILGIYIVVCLMAVAITLLRLVYLRIFRKMPSVVRFHGRQPVKINLDRAAVTPDETVHHFMARLPLNEILRLELTRWDFDVPGLAPELDGLSIAQLSDWHLTGRVGKAYFREVVRACNELQPDLVCITGDIVDAVAHLNWIDDTLGQLTARHGVYFILGNHDLRAAPDRLRVVLKENGLIDLGGRSQCIEINGRPVVLAGNESPWIDGRGLAEQSLRQETAGALRIVLSHSPDQLAWAQVQHVDLMLAGHTHGGQIRIPPLGAIFSPTASGVEHTAGVFYAPPTIMHVTRGISGDIPVRWNCPPEIALLRLRAIKRTSHCDRAP